MTEDAFEMFDGTYVAGSLSRADTERFEDHLVACDECMRRVAALWAVGDLVRLASADAFDGHAAERPAGNPSRTGLDSAGAVISATGVGRAREDPPAFPDELLPRLLVRVRGEQRRRRRFVRLSLVAVAACVLAVTVLATSLLVRTSSSPAPGPSQAVHGTVSASTATLAAELSISTHDSWDQVNLACTYRSKVFTPGNYTAIAADASGRTELVGTWPVIPGQTASILTPTTFRSGQITSVTIRDPNGATLVQLDV